MCGRQSRRLAWLTPSWRVEDEEGKLEGRSQKGKSEVRMQIAEVEASCGRESFERSEMTPVL